MGKERSRPAEDTSSLSLLAGKIVTLFGACVTLLWLTGIGTVVNHFVQVGITGPMSGLCFLLSGFTLLIYSEYGTSSPHNEATDSRVSSLITAAKITSILVIILSLITMFEYLFGFNLRLDDALVGPVWRNHETPIYGKMPLLAAVAFLSTGLVFTTFDLRLGKWVYPGEILALGVLAISVDAFISFLYIGPTGSPSLQAIPIITTLAFMFLSVGLLAAKKDRGLMGIWNANYGGSRVLSNWLPLVIGAFIVAGGIIDYMSSKGYLTRANGYAVFAISMIMFTTVAVFVAAIQLNRAEQKLIRSNRLYDTLSQTNLALVKTGDVILLLNTVCNIFIERGKFKMAWSALREDGGKGLHLVAFSGEGSDELMAEFASLGDLSKIAGVNDVLAGKDFAKYDNIENEVPSSANRDRLLARGYNSMVVLPVKKSGNAVGAIAVYSDEAGFFQEAELKLLEEVSLDLSFALDEMERKKEKEAAEKAAREADELYKRFFDEDITADFIEDSAGQLKSFNPAYLRVFGFTDRAEALETNVAELYPTPEMRKEFIGALAANRKLEYYEHFLRKKDGTPIYVVEHAFGTFNEAGLAEIKHYMFDDTKRKTLEQELIQGKKMESLGTLAGGIAHDFNNLLAIILGYVGLLKTGKGVKTNLARSAGAITDAANRGVGLVRQLLTFARKGDKVVERLSLNDMISDLSKLLEGTFPKTIEINLSLKESLPHVLGDHTQLHQSLINLCVNARDAMIDRKDGKPAGGILRIVTTVTTGDTLVSQISNITSGEYVQVSISDTGIGIDEATLSHMFEPFFTTKEPGKGTGLGLATVYGIIQGHGGFINASSIPGVGTTFSIFLPVAPPTAEDLMKVKIASGDMKGGHETLLVVEDERMLRELLYDTLNSIGYNVLTASDGDKALKEFQKGMGSIKLVVSDIGLPKLSGMDMLKELKKLNPEVKVLFASGFIEAEVKSELLKAGAIAFIQKPYVVRDLAAKIRACLDFISASGGKGLTQSLAQRN